MEIALFPQISSCFSLSAVLSQEKLLKAKENSSTYQLLA